jgi:hypothetical protein
MKRLSMLSAVVIGSIVMVLFILCSCSNKESVSSITIKVNDFSIETYTIDSCEYIGYISGYNHGNMITHKGNCKFCLKRNNK